MHDASPIEAGALRHLRLAPDVHVCVTQNHAVFLDLKHDAYSAIPLNTERPADSLTSALEPHYAVLLGSHLLVEEVGRSLDERLAPTATQHLLEGADRRLFGLAGPSVRDLQIETLDVFRFFAAAGRASLQLKQRHIAEVVGTVRQRKVLLRAPDRSELIHLALIFKRLRPWYARKYLCLFDSLALLHFLAAYGIAANWIFAVQAQPFGAHCWVECDGRLLNEGSEFASQFTPIMLV